VAASRRHAGLALGLAALALSACVAYPPPGVPIGPAPAYAYYPVAPPPTRVEVVPVSPGPAYVWTPGFWVWSGGGYTWTAGRWARPPHGYRAWHSGHWASGPHGHYWTPGRWF
jgi:hypothetical protein